MRVALLLTTDPAALVTTHRYWAPFNAVDGGTTINTLVVAPLYGPTFERLVHDAPAFVDTCH